MGEVLESRCLNETLGRFEENLEKGMLCPGIDLIKVFFLISNVLLWLSWAYLTRI
jgi:hypothetical protein